jgi:hypothetical protein
MLRFLDRPHSLIVPKVVPHSKLCGIVKLNLLI